MFEECDNLTTVKFKEDATFIPAYICKSLSALTTVEISAGVETIGNDAFNGCTSLTSIAIPASVTTIGSGAFCGCTSLASIEIPDKVTTIEGSAFEGCTSLESVEIPGSVTSIGNKAFRDCTGLKEVKLNEGLGEIGYEAFYNCDSLTEITIPKTLTSVHGWGIFGECDNLSLVNFEDGTTVIPAYICKDLTALTMVNIPKTVEKIGYQAFYGCDNLSDIYYEGAKEEWNLIKIEGDNGPLTDANLSFDHIHECGEWVKTKEPTCKTPGVEESKCATCKKTVKKAIPVTEHNYSDWVVIKEATVLSNGAREKKCAYCGDTITETINKIIVNIEESTEYGLANFTVVNAQTLEPIEGAGIFISTEDDGESTFFTDENGKTSVILPVGKHTISAYADGCITRNISIKVEAGVNDIPQIGLSDKDTYEVKMTHKLMTYEEIVDAGIDVSNPDNHHVYQYELRLEFSPDFDGIDIVFYKNAAGLITVPPDRPIEPIPPCKPPRYEVIIIGPCIYIYLPELPPVAVYPISEYYYLVIRGEVKWLKEMFDVEMVVMNNSMTDTLEDLTATLNLPDGLSLAAMADGEQTLSQDLGTIPEGGTKSAHWYVRGDKAGSYNIEALLEGMVMPFEEEIHDVFVAENRLQVWAGDALNLHFEFPNAAYYAEEYPVTITLTNVSDITLYNLTHRITHIEQGKVTYFSKDSKIERVYRADSDESWYEFVPEFKPGDKLVIELDINIMFDPLLMEQQIKNMIAEVDAAEIYVNAYKGIMNTIGTTSSTMNKITDCTVSIDSFLGASDYASIAGNKATLFRSLYTKIQSLEKHMSSGEKTFATMEALANTGLLDTINEITADPAMWVRNATYEEVEQVFKDVDALDKSLQAPATEEEIANFNVFDSIRTLITALPLKFTLERVLYNDGYEENTTTIPWSYTIIEGGPEYFGVSDLSSYLSTISKAIMAEMYADASGSFALIPGIDDPVNYDDIKRELIAIEKEVKEFQAKDATGEVTFRAYYIENQQSKSRAVVENDSYTLSCDNENAVFENGVLTFTGKGTISFVPKNTNGGTLYIEDSEGNTYTYNIAVVEQHDCEECQEQNVILNPTEEYDGFAVIKCKTCNDIMNFVNLTESSCKAHIFGEWTTTSATSCADRGLRKRACKICGFSETEFTDGIAHKEITVNQKDASCGNPGYTGDIVCENCGATIRSGEVIEADEHDYTSETTAPTCEEEGYTTYTCTLCGYSYTGDKKDSLGHSGGEANCKDKAICDVCGKPYGEINANNHKSVVTDNAVASSCSATGLTEGKHCEACGVTIVAQTATDKLPHREETIAAVNATCTASGLTEGKKCSDCGEVIAKQSETPKLGHNMSAFVVSKQPTCTEGGVEISTCTRCTHSETKTIAAKGHSYENGICKVCGDSRVNNCSHMCHKNNFIWKILRFFFKLFKMNPVCECGAKHY